MESVQGRPGGIVLIIDVINVQIKIKKKTLKNKTWKNEKRL